MIEVFPKKVNEEKLQANLTMLVNAFIMLAEDLVEEEETFESLQASIQKEQPLNI